MPIPLIDDPSRGWKQWHRSEVYEKDTDLPPKNNVAHVDDLVVDFDEGLLRVVDVIDGKAVLEWWDPDTGIGSNESNGLIAGLSGYQPSIINRAFLDTSDPLQDYITIDGRYLIFGTESTQMKLFKGTDISPTGLSIARLLDPPYGDTLELVPFSGEPAKKRPPVIPIDGVLADGEIVTLVCYSDTDAVTSVTQFMVVLSSAIAPVANATKTIVDIVLLSPWLDPMEDLLTVPANVGLAGSLGSAEARLLFADGTHEDVTIDGNKCKILGMDNFNSNLQGVITYVVLAYQADTDEFLINGTYDRHITHTYRVITSLDNVDDAYKVYLNLRYNHDNTYINSGNFAADVYLTSGDYTLFRKLEPGEYSISDTDGNPFNWSRAYNITVGVQRLVVRVHMEQVFPELYSSYMYVQQVDVDFNEIGPADNTWILDYLLTGVDRFMGGNKAITTSSYDYMDLDLRCGAANQSAWLDILYHTIHPIFVAPALDYPLPTHFRIMYKDNVHDHVGEDLPLADWDQLYLPPDEVIWKNYGTATIVWLLDDPGEENKLVLGLTPVMIKSSLT